MNIERFIAERRGDWSRLEHQLGAIEKSPARQLDAESLQELVRLYRRTCSDLNQVRSYTANPELLDRLNRITGRAYRFVYQARKPRPIGEALRTLLFAEVPATFRRQQNYVLAAAAAFVFGALAGFGAVLIDSANAERLIPMEFFSERPSERVEKIESSNERIESMSEAATFGAFLYTHNMQVAFLAFSLGALTLVAGYWILFYNGVILGAVAASYWIDGVAVFFLAWVGPHGALELPAIVFAGAAGLRVGQALIFPGDLSRGSSLRLAFPAVWRMMIAVCLILVCAGLIEGSFSQFSAATFPYGLKIGVAALLFAGLAGYLFLRRSPASASGEAE